MNAAGFACCRFEPGAQISRNGDARGSVRISAAAGVAPVAMIERACFTPDIRCAPTHAARLESVHIRNADSRMQQCSEEACARVRARTVARARRHHRVRLASAAAPFTTFSTQHARVPTR
ncbi:hypothetical protein BRPE64_ACDS21710 [Caballeronia insecticola]|uniref:Uncharacterized protein n=1 Tax=Caballeronia insecticola TaxID=758793 RepID=R4WSJ6_9BURK|nr:hypothetical protein BRPE64_ACDS21710 [Caballeronia insecticola]